MNGKQNISEDQNKGKPDSIEIVALNVRGKIFYLPSETARLLEEEVFPRIEKFLRDE